MELIAVFTAQLLQQPRCRDGHRNPCCVTQAKPEVRLCHFLAFLKKKFFLVDRPQHHFLLYDRKSRETRKKAGPLSCQASSKQKELIAAFQG